VTDEAARSQVIAITCGDDEMTVDKGTLRKIVAITYYDDQPGFETVA